MLSFFFLSSAGARARATSGREFQSLVATQRVEAGKTCPIQY